MGVDERMLVRAWQDRADGQGRYPTMGRLVADDGTTATVAVRAGGRHLDTVPEVNLVVPSADVESLTGEVTARALPALSVRSGFVPPNVNEVTA